MANVLRTFSRCINTNRLSKDPMKVNSLWKKSLAAEAALLEKPSNVQEADKFNPLEHEDFFNLKSSFTIKQLFDARVHFGHKEGTLDPKMKPFLFGSRLGHVIFDLENTAELLFAALNFTAHITYRDGVILFVSQNPQTSYLIESTAKDCKEFAHTRMWRQGTFTNSTMIYGAVTRLPDLVIIFNTLTTILEQHPVIPEAAKMAIPVVGIVDSNCNPNLITYPVPGNDDTPVAIELYCKLFKNAVLAGKKRRLSDLSQNV
ncbi:small ribosomal subunit protein uS2m [Halyomorpha halys]|uniref:small ribosomal subunit protein uS2m n=1 Tax=Halyomorpha halys TaxID=286706 RepID=UPI0006D4D036|nr:28S ribosomal protein S2, mitochondrial [Halyomorpha halys]